MLPLSAWRPLLGAAWAVLLPTGSFAQGLTPLPEQLYAPPVYGGSARAIAAASSAKRAAAGAPLTLTDAVRRALAANPRLTAAERDIGIAAGKRLQASAIPNPELSVELDDAFGSGDYRGMRAAETTVQLSQLIELGGKREARVAAGAAEVEGARMPR